MPLAFERKLRNVSLVVVCFFFLAFEPRNPTIQIFAAPGQLGFALLERGMLLPKLRLPRLDQAHVRRLLVRLPFALQRESVRLAVDARPLFGELTLRRFDRCIFSHGVLPMLRFPSGGLGDAPIDLFASPGQLGPALFERGNQLLQLGLLRLDPARLRCLLVGLPLPLELKLAVDLEIAPLLREIALRNLQLALSGLDRSTFGCDFLGVFGFADGHLRDPPLQLFASASQYRFALGVLRIKLARLL
jgi:hypothetical protein